MDRIEEGLIVFSARAKMPPIDSEEDTMGFVIKEERGTKVVSGCQIKEDCTCLLIYRDRGRNGPVSRTIVVRAFVEPFRVDHDFGAFKSGDWVFGGIVVEAEGVFGNYSGEKLYPLKIFGIDGAPDEGNDMFIYPPSSSGCGGVSAESPRPVIV